MPELSWTEMIELHPAGHLVVGNVVGSTAAASSLLVARLLRGCGIDGDYSLARIKEPQGPTIHCLFANKADADQFSDAVGARPIGKYAGWASQRSFTIDDGTRTAISDVLKVAPL